MCEQRVCRMESMAEVVYCRLRADLNTKGYYSLHAKYAKKPVQYRRDNYILR